MSVADYQAVLKELLAAKTDLDAMTKKLASAADALHKRNRVWVSHVDVEFSKEITTDPQAPVIDGENWPTPEAIATTLQAWRDAKHRANKIWEGLSEDDRVGFHSPAELEAQATTK